MSLSTIAVFHRNDQVPTCWMMSVVYIWKHVSFSSIYRKVHFGLLNQLEYFSRIFLSRIHIALYTLSHIVSYMYMFKKISTNQNPSIHNHGCHAGSIRQVLSGLDAADIRVETFDSAFSNIARSKDKTLNKTSFANLYWLWTYFSKNGS